jgi:TPR repeat protein
MVGFLNMRVALQLAAGAAMFAVLSACGGDKPTDTTNTASVETAAAEPADYSFKATFARAQRGDAIAQHSLGVRYRSGGIDVPQDYAAAMSWYRKAAEQGNANAQTDLARMYQYGEGVARNYAAAGSWYRKAADQGNANAQNNLGAMYEYGMGVAQDYVQAHKWYNLAGAGAEVAEVRDQAIKSRDIAAAKMQPAQIAEAQRLASAWRKK